MKTLRLALVGTVLALASLNAHALSVMPENHGRTLVDALLGPGVTIDPGSISYLGGAGQAGIFSNGRAGGIGIDQGIILTTGLGAYAEGPNISDSRTFSWGRPGDSDLNEIVGGLTLDANILQFDFQTSTTNLFFDYVFASEEYNEYAGSFFNDVLAFFVDGENIARVNGEPLSISTVNCGFNLIGPGHNCELYNNNDPSDGGPFFQMEYDGFTDVLTASIMGLSPGMHTVKLAIADRGDPAFDSAVFIKAGSFSAVPAPVPAPGTLALMSLGIMGLGFSWRRR